MEKSNKRGKIPQQDWPSIIARYEAGETLSSIARTYDCSPPAISYIVSRSRARNAVGEPAAVDSATPPEPQLVKAHSAEAGPTIAPRVEAGIEPAPADNLGAAAVPVATDPVADSQPPVPRSEPDRFGPGRGFVADPTSRGTNGVPERQLYDRGDPRRSTGGNGIAGTPPSSGDQQRTLRLSAHDNGVPSRPEPQPARPVGAGGDENARPQQFGGEPRFGPQTRPSAQYQPPGYREPARAPSEPTRPREAGTFIDQELRQRVDGDIAAFLAAFDAALAADTLESRIGLREATDRLLRAGARTRIELERLEARIPLAPRSRGTQAGPAWRQS